MPTELLVHAFDHDNILKGMIEQWRDDDRLAELPWGNLEGPPNFCIIRVTDAASSQVQALFDTWSAEFTVAFVNSGQTHDRFNVQTDARVTAVFGGDILPLVREITRDFDGDVFRDTNVQQILVDIPHGNITQRLLENEVRRRYGATHAPNRYQVASADVDQALQQPGGRLEQTTATVMARLVDRLNP